MGGGGKNEEPACIGGGAGDDGKNEEPACIGGGGGGICGGGA